MYPGGVVKCAIIIIPHVFYGARYESRSNEPVRFLTGLDCSYQLTTKLINQNLIYYKMDRVILRLVGPFPSPSHSTNFKPKAVVTGATKKGPKGPWQVVFI